MTFEELMDSTPPVQQHALVKGYQAGFAAGAANRDAEVTELVDALAAMENDAEECLDFDEFTAMLVPMDNWHLVFDALAKVRKP